LGAERRMGDQVLLHNGFQANIARVWRQLRSGGQWQDCTLVPAEGEPVGAHRIVLAAGSPYFQAEFGKTSAPHPVLLLPEVKRQDLFRLLDFLYHGEASVPTEELLRFLSLAEKFTIRGLVGDLPEYTATADIEKETTQKVDGGSENPGFMENYEWLCDDLFSSKEETLGKACYEGDIKTVAKLLSEGTDVNGQDDPKVDGLGSTLHIAMDGKNTKIVELLLSKPETRLDMTDEEGRTPLHIICGEKSEGEWSIESSHSFDLLIPLLLFCKDYRCSEEVLNKKNKAGKTALMVAVDNALLPQVAILAKVKGVDWNTTDFDGETLLEFARNKVEEWRNIVDANNKLINQIVEEWDDYYQEELDRLEREKERAEQKCAELKEDLTSVTRAAADTKFMEVPHWVAELIHKRSLEILAIVTKKQQDMDIIIID